MKSGHADNLYSVHKIHTHYDNLKVARNAPEEVIRAAYRSLAQKYHPDLHGTDPEAAKIMKMINAAYEVLSDPEKRRQHDLWIAEREQRRGPAKPGTKWSRFTRRWGGGRYPGQRWLFPVFAGMGLALIAAGHHWLHSSFSPTPRETVWAGMKGGYSRPATAPNGQPWPSSAGYIAGFQQQNDYGMCKVTVDNRQKDSDVLVKLVCIDGAKAYPVRTFYIPEHESFTVDQLSPGTYDLRYRDLASGKLSRSDPFELREEKIEGGIENSHVTMTLFKVLNGNLPTYPLAEEEFN